MRGAQEGKEQKMIREASSDELEDVRKLLHCEMVNSPVLVNHDGTIKDRAHGSSGAWTLSRIITFLAHCGVHVEPDGISLFDHQLILAGPIMIDSNRFEDALVHKAVPAVGARRPS
jgi:hypothetical protein